MDWVALQQALLVLQTCSLWDNLESKGCLHSTCSALGSRFKCNLRVSQNALTGDFKNLSTSSEVSTLYMLWKNNLMASSTCWLHAIRQEHDLFFPTAAVFACRLD